MGESVKVSMRLSQSDKDWLTQVADAAGMSLSAFLRMSAFKEAHKVLGPRVAQLETPVFEAPVFIKIGVCK